MARRDGEEDPRRDKERQTARLIGAPRGAANGSLASSVSPFVAKLELFLRVAGLITTLTSTLCGTRARRTGVLRAGCTVGLVARMWDLKERGLWPCTLVRIDNRDVYGVPFHSTLEKLFALRAICFGR